MHPLVSDTPSFGQHYRYVGRTRDSRGTMVPSEAPLLHSQVKLVDPVDRQAWGLWAGDPLSYAEVSHIYPMGMVGRVF